MTERDEDEMGAPAGMLTGRQVPAAEALAIGLVDRLAGENASQEALALARAEARLTAERPVRP
ncbi:MAG: hypothetical protein WAK82_27740 [Streptosporangiaceae bacterium]